LFIHLGTSMQQQGQEVQTGRFGADMQVNLCNDGPVTFNLRVPPKG
jgi:D-tyrosyl-tRNA(Tyr) deacylase